MARKSIEVNRNGLAQQRFETELNSIAELCIEKKWNSSDLLGNGEE